MFGGFSWGRHCIFICVALKKTRTHLMVILWRNYKSFRCFFMRLLCKLCCVSVPQIEGGNVIRGHKAPHCANPSLLKNFQVFTGSAVGSGVTSWNGLHPQVFSSCVLFKDGDFTSYIVHRGSGEWIWLQCSWYLRAFTTTLSNSRVISLST